MSDAREGERFQVCACADVNAAHCWSRWAWVWWVSRSGRVRSLTPWLIKHHLTYYCQWSTNSKHDLSWCDPHIHQPAQVRHFYCLKLKAVAVFIPFIFVCFAHLLQDRMSSPAFSPKSNYFVGLRNLSAAVPINNDCDFAMEAPKLRALICRWRHSW